VSEAQTIVFDPDIKGRWVVGRLGAYSDASHPRFLQAAQMDMIERHILRLEEALRRAGINIDELELPE
jgi:hypothetical protein